MSPWRGRLDPTRLEALTRALDEPDVKVGADAERSRVERRARGMYFTPPALVRFTVAEVLGAWLARADDGHWRDDGSPRLRLLDPSAGDGRFLAAATDYLTERARLRGHDPSRARAQILRRCVLGVERDGAFAVRLRERLPGAQIECRDALAGTLAREPVDVILGNPPYVRSLRMGAEERARLGSRYAATSHGEWDLYAAFIEAAWDALAPGGELGLVVPSRWLTAAFARPLRGKLAAARCVRALVDFGDEQIFDQATTYTSVAFLSAAREEAPRVRVARRMLGAWAVDEVAADRLSDAPWLLALEREGAGLAALSSRGDGGPAATLGQVARLAKGVGTNADRVFVLERVSLDGARVRGWSRALGCEVEVEAEATRRCARGRDVRGYGAIGDGQRCVWPYDERGALVTPEDMARFPRTMAYLERCRDRLMAREGGKYADERFYRFGRPQNLGFMADGAPKVVFPDIVRHGRALLDHSGAVVMDSAYALRLRASAPEGISLALVVALLNAPLLRAWLVLTGVPLRGGYVRAKPAYLDALPLPAPGEHTARAARLVGDGRNTSAAAVNEALRLAYGVDAATWSHLGAY